MLSDYFDLMSIALKESYFVRISFTIIVGSAYFYLKGKKNYDR